ncbi:DUF2252 domain-containing protein [Actimicrobium antarcticum]|uniref:DUF2252 domain-containing protein n=1 Tax=Actimicrobium antarcticum TaxID=1051899 RepID=A0ABP7TP40_9BURK
MNIVNKIKNANTGREPERLAMKYQAMRRNPFVFMRGSCSLFYDRLVKTGIVATAPLVWSCGDLHSENFGSYKGDNRLVYVDMNDFDEAALAPASWDLVRMLTSILLGAQSFGMSDASAKALCVEFLGAYGSTLSTGRAIWLERDTSHGAVRHLLDQVRCRTRVAFLDSRTERKGKRRSFRLTGTRMLPVTAQQRSEVTTFIAGFARGQPDPDFYKVLDVARRVAGTGSLGVDRYAILVQGKGSPDQNYLLDLKEARQSSIATHLPGIQPVWRSHAERVLSVQQRMQAVPMAFLHAVDWKDTSYILRALQPSEDRVVFSASGKDASSLPGVANTMGVCVASAQLRSAGRQNSAIADALMAFANRKKWAAKLLVAATDMADRTTRDWMTYCDAYDALKFAPAAGGSDRPGTK